MDSETLAWLSGLPVGAAAGIAVMWADVRNLKSTVAGIQAARAAEQQEAARRAELLARELGGISSSLAALATAMEDVKEAMGLTRRREDHRP